VHEKEREEGIMVEQKLLGFIFSMLDCGSRHNINMPWNMQTIATSVN
jgi:hypothetical protein